ncbi:hypothetical protein M9Q43_11990 [Flavobacterium sp. HXWNR29]|uniref:hypothetical protein n=1 Tax=Flavobacterium odoriferum TaxID=2946604 RepID=UPI0021CAE53D|nr:hypothetical protein [Flavobacterium sp. HXWNR29]MCU4189876.1 hypothetical protein [Flavobacterium sp. HXWNR29]
MGSIIETRFVISDLYGNRLESYSNKEELINDCVGIVDLEFGCEIFKQGSILKWKNSEFKINSVEVEFESILINGDRIEDDNNRIKKTNIIVLIYVED